MSPEALLEQDFGVITDLVHAHAQERPRHAAVICNERVCDYGSLDELVDRLAASLQRDGVLSGDAVALCASASIEYVAVFLGALRAGAAVAPLAPSATSEALLKMLADSRAKILFADAPLLQALRALQLPGDLTLVAIDDADGAKQLQTWLAAPGTQPAPVGIAPDAPFNIIYSSGTTGSPKGIVQPHRMRWAHVRRAAGVGYDRTAVVLCSTPLYSNTTLVSLFPALTGGGTLVLMPKFDAAGFLELAQRHLVTHAMLVPVQYQRIMDVPDFGRYDLRSFRLKFCTSAPFSPALKADVLRRWPGGLVEYYGLTEGGGTCVLVAHQFTNKLHTVGQPIEGHDIRLIDESGKEVPRGEVGEIVGRSPAMMSGYYNQPGQTSQAEWYDAEGRRYLRTGDVGRFDADGFLTLLDRRKDMIISGGFNIYPSDLEAVLLRHEGVRDVAVVGVPSREWGETPVAFVVLREGRNDSAEEIREFVNGQVGKMQRVAAVSVVRELPRSAIGKVLKRELRERVVASGI